MNRPSRRSHDELIRSAHNALEAEEFDEAEALARRALMSDPESIEARQVLSSTMIEQGRYEEALVLLEQLMARDPEDSVTYSDAGVCYMMICEFDRAEAALTRALELDDEDLTAIYWMGLCVERRGDYAAADELFVRAHRGDEQSFPAPQRMSRREFQATVNEVLRDLPAEIRDQFGNLAIIIDDLPREEDLTDYEPPLDPCLYGLYVGVPLPARSNSDAPRLPDTIYIYQRNLERVCNDLVTLRREIRITILHEVGHYLGYDEDELAQRGLA